MPTTIRGLVVALVAFAMAGALLLWSGLLEPAADPPSTTVQLFPAPEPWPGVRWSRIDQPDLNERGASIHGLSSYGSWIAAWGESLLPDPAGGAPSTAAVVWTSSGGLAWERHELRLVTGQRILPQNLAVGPAGYLVYGLRGHEDNVGLVAVSKDAEHWVEVGRPPIDLGGPLAATETGFVTVGVKAGEPLVLTTSDGASWEKVTVPAKPGAAYMLSDVRRTADGFVVAGRVERGRDWDGVLWRSTGGGPLEDIGTNPTFSSPDRGVDIWRTVPFAGGIVVTGAAGNIAECASGLVASLDPVIADTCPGPPAAAWGSPDGKQWQEVVWPAQGGGPGQMPSIHVITAGAAGVVGLVEEAPQGERNVVGLWTSRDGIEWSRIGNGMPLGAGGLNGQIVGLPGRLIVFAWTGTGTAAWVGTPGG